MRTITLGVASIAFAASACGGGGGGGGGSSGEDTSGNVTGRTCAPLQAVTPAASALESKFQGTVFTIVMENKGRTRMLYGSEAPYLRSLAAQYAIADGYTDTMVHPSEPNYIWMVSGENFGILDDDAPVAHHIATTSHLVDQIDKVGRSWKAYQESMGEPCKVVSSGQYAVKHNPFVFFDDLVSWTGKTPTRSQRCIDHVVDYSQLDADLAADNVADYVFITPNMINDMHDGTVAQGDAWLKAEVPKILASNAWKNGGVLIITADEGEEGDERDQPPFVLISPLGKKGYVSDVAYDTSSYLKTVQAILGVEPLPCGDPSRQVDTMDDLFETAMPSMLAATTP